MANAANQNVQNNPAAPGPGGGFLGAIPIPRWMGGMNIGEHTGEKLLGSTSKEKLHSWKDAATRELASGMHGMFADGAFADFTIAIGGTDFKVHKVVVASRSRYFKNACEGGFREAESARIDLSEDKPEIVKALIDYMYTLKFKTLADATSHDGKVSWAVNESSLPRDLQDLPLFFLIEVYVAADKYEVRGLRELASTKLADLLHSRAQLEEDDQVAPAVTLKLLEMAYSLTPEGASVRHVLQEHVLSSDMTALLKHEKCKEVMMAHPVFLFDMLKVQAKDAEPVRSVCCDKKLAKAIVVQGCDESDDPRALWATGAHFNEATVVRSFHPGIPEYKSGKNHLLRLVGAVTR